MIMIKAKINKTKKKHKKQKHTKNGMRNLALRVGWVCGVGPCEPRPRGI